MDRRWRPGDAVALREVWRGRIWTARAATVVDDGTDRTIFYVAPGMRWKCPILPNGVWQRLPSDDWVLGDRVWQRYRVLSFAWPGIAHAWPWHALSPARTYGPTSWWMRRSSHRSTPKRSPRALTMMPIG